MIIILFLLINKRKFLIMGLDIFKYRYDKKGKYKCYIPFDLDNEKNEFYKNFIKKYNQFLLYEENKYFDIHKYCIDNSIDYNDILSIVMYDKVKVTLKNDIIIEVNINEFPYFFKKNYYLLVNEIDYQRKGMKDDFYKLYLYENKIILWTNSQLNSIRKYVEKGSDILKWHLDKFEFIYFDY